MLHRLRQVAVPCVRGLGGLQLLQLFEESATGVVQRQDHLGGGQRPMTSGDALPLTRVSVVLWKSIFQLQAQQQAVQPPAPTVLGIIRIAPPDAVLSVAAPANAGGLQ